MKRIVLLWCCMLLLLAGTLALSILWGAQAWEYAEYEHEYAEIRKAVIPVNPARMNSQREAPCEQTAHEQPVSEDDNNDNTQLPEAPSKKEYAEIKSETDQARNQREYVDFAELSSQNPDTVGWLYIPDTKVDYPVVQAADNEWYLDRNFKGKQASCGTIFMDYQNSNDPLDRNTILYGHNMSGSSSLMFSSLTRYKKPGYFQAHPILQFDTPSQPGRWQVFAVCHLSTETIKEKGLLRQDFVSEDEFAAYAATLQSLALYDTGVTVPASSKTLTLVTCDRTGGYGADGRLLVVAVLI